VDVITIDVERCTGCGACLEVCPTGALYLMEGTATADSALCRECEACLAACPSEAITLTSQEEPAAEAVRVLAPRREPEIIHIKTRPAPVPLRAVVLPAVGMALAWAGREILPRLADSLLVMLERRTTALQAMGTARSREALATSAKGGSRKYRHRWRGGGG
jgi:NAD-dependent dihydropyrimidine dehydrogenase PreA subunit